MCHRTKRFTAVKNAHHPDAPTGNALSSGGSTSKCVAKERLKLMIDTQKRQLDDDTLSQIRHEIGSVITKYVDIEPENVEIKIILKDYKSRPNA